MEKDYHGAEQAEAEKKNFEEVFQKRKDPDDAAVKKLSGGPYSLNQVFDGAKEEFKAMGIDSRSKLLSLVGQGAVKIDGQKISDAATPAFMPRKRHLLKIGRHFLNIDLT